MSASSFRRRWSKVPERNDEGSRRFPAAILVSLAAVVGAVLLTPGTARAQTKTVAGTATAAASTTSCTAISVSAPYTGDSNGNNTLNYQYRTPSGTGTWTTGSRTHTATPYVFDITGLTLQATYDVQVTYVDTDGVNGTATQTITNITVGANCTVPGSVTMNGATCGQATVSAAFTGDANANGSTTFERGPSSTGAWTATGCGATTGASPRTCVDATASGSWWYRATFTDADGISGTNPVVSASPVAVTACSLASTTVGTVSATPGGTSAAPIIAVSAAYTDDSNGSNSLSYRTRTPSGTGTWSAASPVAHAASPYAFDVAAACGASYDVEVTFVDADGVNGTNPTTLSNVQTVACPNIVIGDASAGEAATTLAPGAASVALDAFTLQTSTGVVAPASITVTLSSGSAPLIGQLTLEDTQACDHLTAHATITSPATDAPAFTAITGLPISTSPTTLWICLTPRTHASMPPPPGSQVSVTGQVTGVTATGYTQTGSDVASAARTIDNLSPDAPGSFAGTASGAQVSFTWTNPADGAQAVVLRWVGSAAGSDVPLEGKGPDYAVGDAVGAATVACVVSAPGTSCTDATVVSGTTYAYAIFSRDANRNWSLAAPSTPASFTPTAPSATTMLVSGADPAGARICPGASAYVDRFGFTVTGAADTIGTLTVQGLGASAPLASLEIRNDSGTALSPARTGTPLGDTYLFGSASLLAPVGTTYYRLYVTVRPYDSLVAGDIPIQPTVQSFGSLNAPSGSDSANGFVVDHSAPAQAIWGTVTPGAGTIQLAWTNPTDVALQQVFVLRREATTPFTETFPGGSPVPEQGTFTAGGSYVLWSGTATSGAPVTFTDTGVVEGTGYVYRVYAVDACGNFNDGASSGPWSPTGAFIPEGSTTAGAPMVSIVNPRKGNVVSGTFRVQIRVYNPLAQGGIAGISAGSLAYSLDDGATWTSTGLGPLSAYDTSTSGTLTGRTFEVQLTPAAGKYTLRAQVSNAVASNVRSNGVPITAVSQASGGDGRLLVRDNSSQLCADCHASHAHTAETTQSAKGSWATTCRDCHAPHGTRNLFLVSEQITPPALSVPTTPKTVTFYNTSGYASDSFANGSSTGVCQVCHTQTKFYRADGTSPGGTHETGPCTSCHNHSKGLAASCTTCHGTSGRVGVAGADALVAAAPPVVAPGAAVYVASGGAHLAHVNQTTWRSAPLACRECHAIPNTHQTPSQTDVLWNTLASTGGVVVQPASGAIAGTWTTTPTCTNWCHGAGLAGGGGTNDGVTNPIWTGTSAACGSCHASPPPVDGTPEGDHPQNFACASCHGGDYARTSIGPTSKATHIDGTLQKPAMGCTACHGALAGLSGTPVANTSPTAAPGYDPGVGAIGVDTHGSSDRTVASVGAHDRHVDPAMMTPKACGVCHGATPADGDTAHANGVVGIGFTAPANAGGVTTAPTAFTSGWEASPSCTNYCHSSGKPIGLPVTTASPVWTSTTGMACTSCHGNATTLATNAHPKHLQVYGIGCQACHAGTTDDGASIVLGGGLHVDGANSVRFTTTDVLWAPFVTGGGYDTGFYTCSSTYCHSNGTSATSPFPAPVGGALAWTGTTSCTSCHGGPSGAAVVMGVGAANGSAKHAKHVDNAAVVGSNYFCGDCHQATLVAGTNATFSNRANHVDRTKTVSIANRGAFASADTGSTCGATYCHSSGQATPAYVSPAPTWADAAWTTVCNGCHGRSNATGAPDYANGGPGAATANSHAKHTSSGTDATSCQNCHSATVAASGTAILANSTLHTNGARDISILATYDANGATPNYDSTTKTCSAVSCHGSGTPQWGATLGCTGCHGDAARTSIAGADANQKGAPPLGLAGETLSSTRAVGAHVAHVNQATLRTAPLPCSECHLSATHNGVKQVAWGTLATTGGRIPNWTGTTCASTYCHAPGGTEAGGSIRTPSWTSGSSQAACGTCHGAPPPVGGGIAGADHPQNTGCASCHGTGYSLASAATANHVNGSTVTGVDKPNNGCTACHGVLAGVSAAGVPNTSMTAAPGYVDATTGVDTTGASAATVPKVGAHDAHVRGHIGATVALDCSNCHGTKPAAGDTAHANGTIGIGWSALATTGVTASPTAFGAAWEASPGCTNYCHSNAAPTGGTAATTTVQWTSTTQMTCASCHATVGRDTSGLATDLSQKHGKHVNAATYAFKCDECHAATMANDSATSIGTPANHLNGAKNVQFSSTLLTTAIDQSAGSYATGTCSATYCHSGGVATAVPFSATASAALSWTTGASTCRECHGWTSAARPTIGVATSSSFQGSPTHASHVDNAAVIGTNFVCADCHSATIASGNSPITNFAKHVNGVKDVQIAQRGTFVSTEPYTGGSCSATYCHSSGQATPAYRTIAWTAAGIGCNGCHGQSSTTGAPDYASGAAGSATANSHAKHTSNGTDATTCQNCHSLTVTAAGTAISGNGLHVNGSRDVSILGTYDTNGATSNYDSVTKACSAVSCHGSGAPVWGGTVTCLGCHGTTGAETTDLVASFWNNGVTTTINTNEWAYSGHGKAAGTYDVTANPAAAFPTSPTAGTSECLYCHDDTILHGTATNPFRLRGTTDANGVSAAYSTASPNATCLNCHAATGSNGVDPDGTATAYSKKNGTLKPDAAHDGAKHTIATLGGKFCWDCHDAHGDRVSTGGNVAMIRANVTAVSDGTYGYVGASGSQRAVSYSLQTASPPATGKAVETTTAAGTQHVGLCQACHADTGDTLLAATAWTKYWNRLGYDDPSGPPNTDRVASAHNSGSTATPYCISCHSHSSKFAGAGESSGGAACDGCHSDLYLSMTTGGTHYHKLMAADTTYPLAAPTSTTDPNRKCLMCHVDHNIFRPDLNASGGRGKNLRTDITLSPTAANTASYGNRDFDPSLTAGGICVSCHTNTMPRNADATAGTVTMAVTKTGFSGSAHTFSGAGTTATFVTGGGGTAVMIGDCGKCHDDTSAKQYQSGYLQATHNSALRSMQAPLGITAPTDPLAENQCFRCHSQTTDTTPGGGPAKTAASRDYFNLVPMTTQSERIFQVVTNSTSYPWGHPIGGASGLHKTSDGEGNAANDGSLSGANRHATCGDCHNPHAAKPVPASQRGSVTAWASGAAPNMDTLTDSSKSTSWTANQWVGYTVKILSGTGAGSMSAVYANTTTTLSVEFGTAVPAVGSTYVILGTGRANGNAAGGAEANSWGVVPTFPAQPPPPTWNDFGAIANADDITGQYNAITAWTRTTAPALQGQICVKCHSSYAYGTTPPNTLSGIGTASATGWSNTAGTAMKESDIANQFNPNNLSHHAVFARGKNQPLVSSDTVSSTYNSAWPKFTTGTVAATNASTAVTFTTAVPTTTLPGWFIYIGATAPAQGIAGWYEIASVTDGTHLVLDRAYTGATGTGKAFMLTAGLGNNFVPPWGPWSTLQCSDCHSSDSATDPFGPHGSGTKWILTKAFTQTFMFYNGTAVAAVSLAPADGNNVCLNCHRTDVYGDYNVVGPTNKGFARQTHPMDTSQGQAWKTKPKWGIVCMNCHGGARAGTIHGTNLGIGSNGTLTGGSYSGKRLLAGAYWSGVTRSTTTAAGSCFVKGTTDSVSNCGNGNEGTFAGPANYGYDDATP